MAISIFGDDKNLGGFMEYVILEGHSMDELLKKKLTTIYSGDGCLREACLFILICVGLSIKP